MRGGLRAFALRSLAAGASLTAIAVGIGGTLTVAGWVIGTASGARPKLEAAYPAAPRLPRRTEVALVDPDTYRPVQISGSLLRLPNLQFAGAPIAAAMAKVQTRDPVPAHTGSLPPQKTVEIALAVPLPRSRPVITRPADILSSPDAAPLVTDKTALLANKTAIYDIEARTVYMPNGDRLEAHSGLGEFMDDPSSHKYKMRGVTPPNTYNLKLRESLFHGVQAIRLNPVDEERMHGRDGILAHTYMLGPSGQSNGCVSFKNYPQFLRAFLRGEVERMVVVASLNNNSIPVARATPRSRRIERYASTDRYASSDRYASISPKPYNYLEDRAAIR